jgi:putative transposase
VPALCEMLEVARSGFYRWRPHSPSPRAQAHEQLLAHLREAFAQSRQTYGSPRLTRALQRQKVACSEKRVARLMRLHGLQAKSKRPFRPRTTQSDPSNRVAPNLVFIAEDTNNYLTPVFV